MSYCDNTLPGTEFRRLQSFWAKRVRKLSATTKFSRYELQALSLIFHKICLTHEWWGASKSKKQRDRLDRFGFFDGLSPLMGITSSCVLESLFKAVDSDYKRYITMNNWFKLVQTIFGTHIEKSLLCWQAYDPQNKGIVLRTDMALRARDMFLDSTSDDYDGLCKEYVDVILKGTKAAKDFHMTLAEYLDIVTKRPLYQEFLGNVLPCGDAADAFWATFAPQPMPRRKKRPKIKQYGSK